MLDSSCVRTLTLTYNSYCFTRLPNVNIDYSLGGPITSDEFI